MFGCFGGGFCRLIANLLPINTNIIGYSIAFNAVLLS